MITLPEDDTNEYAEWLMANAELNICEGAELVRHLDNRTRYDEFLAYRDAQMARDSVKF